MPKGRQLKVNGKFDKRFLLTTFSVSFFCSSSSNKNYENSTNRRGKPW